MTLSLEEISDRLEIQDLLVRYCDAVDSRQLDLLDPLFTDDAIIDYSALGGPCGDLATAKHYLTPFVVHLPMWQHMIGQTLLNLDGDTARARTPCHNPVIRRAGDDPDLLISGCWYRDELVRAVSGWRIRRRTLEPGYIKEFPTRG